MPGVTMPPLSDIKFEKFREQHINELLKLMNREKWYYYDYKELSRYLKLKEVCYVLKDDENVIGSIFTTNYGNQAWLGNILVHKDFRGKGLGQDMIYYVVEKLIKMGVNTFRLGSVPLAIGLYKRLGFHPELLTTAQEADLPLKKNFEETGNVQNVRKILQDDLEEICNIDESYFKSNRYKLFNELYNDSIKESCLCLEEKGRIVGFIMIRRRSSSKKEGDFNEGPDYVYRLGPSCVLPGIGIEGFKILFQEALRPINSEVEKFEGNAKIFVSFPRNADEVKVFEDLIKLGKAMGIENKPEEVFSEHQHIFNTKKVEKNDVQWKYMKSLGFNQEYFEQVMSYTPNDAWTTSPENNKANETKLDPTGIFASATPGDKA